MAIVGEQEVAAVGELMEVILHVQDMNSQVAFYRDKLGLGVSYPTGTEDYSKEGWVTLETGRCVLALHEGGTTRLGESPSHRIVFRTEDIHAARNQILRKGVQAGEIRSPAPEVQVFDARDPEGNVFSNRISPMNASLARDVQIERGNEFSKSGRLSRRR